MGFFGQLINAGWSAVSAFRNSWDNPEAVGGGLDFNRAQYFRLLWAHYSNEVFEDPNLWGWYRKQLKLYRQTRSLYNPTRRLCDFYAGQIYPGVLSLDGARLPEGVPLAIPLADDTPEEIRQACGQFWQWTNFQSQKSVLVRYGAVAGSVLVEIDDNVERGKVAANVVWPALVAWIDLDPAGNLKGYSLRYLVTDDNGQRYEYRKDVYPDRIETFRDSQPYNYEGAGAVFENIYGFVPAVWVKHKDIGSNYGAPAIYGSISKVNEINSLASHIHDQIHKVVGAPLLFTGSGNITNLFGRAKRGETDEFSVPEADRESVLMLKGPVDAKVATLAGDLPLADSAIYLDKLIGEVEQDHPELAMYRELRAMSQVTGPGASRMMGDAAATVLESAANYDQQVIKLHQMALAVAGMRANAGDWGTSLTRQQQRFLPFGLDSYARGELDFDIEMRPLIPLSPMEQIAKERAQLSLEADRKAATVDVAAVAQRIQTTTAKAMAGALQAP